MTDKQKIDEFFWNKTTPEVARDLLGMYLEHDTPEGRLAGYIVDAEAYLGPEDEAAHSYGLRRTPRVRAMYEKPGTIYLYTMHTHRILNIITQPEGIPQGVMIRAIEPAAMIDQMSKNRGGKTGPDISNGPGKLVEALAIPQELYGQSIADSSLRLVFEK
ncbi:DNA-3-methyladenine glycosylase, partial [Enterococcus faecium]|nr:DNA-3-methyladenine glycosylase [Enterococcus faecium]